MRKWNVALALAPLAFGLLVTSARADSKPADRPCAADVQKFCHGVEPGGGRYRECLKQHVDELSPPCKERMQQRKAAYDRLRKSCEADVKKLCGDQAEGRGAVACLRQHRDEVSAECKDQLALARAGAEKHHGTHAEKAPAAATPSAGQH